MYKPVIRNSVSYEDRSRNNYFYNRPMRTNQEMQRRMPNWQNGSGLNQNERHLSAKIRNDHPAFPFYNGLRKNQPIKPTLLLPPRANYYQNMSSDFDNRREPEPYKSVKNPSSRGRKHFPYSRRFNDGFEDYSKHPVNNFMENQNHRPMQKHWYREDVGRGMQRYNENEQNAFTRSKDFERHRYIERPKRENATFTKCLNYTCGYNETNYNPNWMKTNDHWRNNHYNKYCQREPKFPLHKGISPRSNYCEHISYKWPSYRSPQYAPREKGFYEGNQNVYDHYAYQRAAVWTSPKNHFYPNWTKKNDYCRNNPNVRYCQPEAEFLETMKINEGFQPIRGYQTYQLNGYAHKMGNRPCFGNGYCLVHNPNTQESYANRDQVYSYRKNENATFNTYVNRSTQNNFDPRNYKWLTNKHIRRDNATDFSSDNQSILSKISVPNIMAKNMKPFNSNKEKEIILNKQRKSFNVLPEENVKVNKEKYKNDVRSGKRNKKHKENFGPKEKEMIKKTTSSDSSNKKDISCDLKPPCVSKNVCESQTNEEEATKFGLNNELITITNDSSTSNEERSISEIINELQSSPLVQNVNIECSEENEQTTRKNYGRFLKDKVETVTINFCNGEEKRTEEEMIKGDDGNDLLRKEITAKEDFMENKICCSIENDDTEGNIENQIVSTNENEISLEQKSSELSIKSNARKFSLDAKLPPDTDKIQSVLRKSFPLAKEHCVRASKLDLETNLHQEREKLSKVGSGDIVLDDLNPIGPNSSSMLGDQQSINFQSYELSTTSSLEKSSKHTDLSVSFESNKIPLFSTVNATNNDSKSTPDVAKTKHNTHKAKEHQSTPFPKLNNRSSEPLDLRTTLLRNEQ